MATRTKYPFPTRLARLVIPLLATIAMIAGQLTGIALASHEASESVSFTLEGCRNPSVDLESTGFVCADGDYTTGNLGKTWNELDLVPHRVTTTAGNSAPDTQTYTVAIVADNVEAGVPGYDAITAPTLNAAKSHGSCSISSSAQQTLTPGVGGTDVSIYRLVTVTQAKNSTCVFDYAERLALGSHAFSGSSLHSNLLNEHLSTAGVGNKDVSIPVKQILPQSISKDMSASQGSDHTWNVTKSSSPTSIAFGDVCAPSATLSKTVSVTVSWTKSAANPGAITVTTNIYATNPAHRSVNVSVTDVIRSGTDALDTKVFDPVTVPAGTTNHLVGTHTLEVPAGTTDLNDVATATYTDTDLGIAVPGQTTATASVSTVSSSGTTNGTAVITDSEWITGDGLSFSVDSVTGASGTFGGGYTLGTEVTPSQASPLVWTSASQSTSGSVTFNKTIYLDQVRITSGTLSDVAALTGSDGFTDSSSQLDVGITSTATVSLTINKTIPDVLTGDETVTFRFDVYDSAGNLVAENVSITFTAGETADSATVTGLAPGSYKVSEDDHPSGAWNSQPDENVNITLPNCSGSVTFDNDHGAATASVAKVTLPSGSEAGWEFTLTGPGLPSAGETVTTTGTDYIKFSTPLQEGTYTVTETEQTGWDLIGVKLDGAAQTGTVCTFTVDYPADAGESYQCEFTNREEGSITVIKQTDPDGSTQSFSFDASTNLGADFALTDGGSKSFTGLVPATYSVDELVPSGWQLTSISCDDTDATINSEGFSIDLAAGENVTCTFNNREDSSITVIKQTVPDGSTQSFTFDPSTSLSGDNFQLNDDGAKTYGTLAPGTYGVDEVVPTGWDLISVSCDDDDASTTSTGFSIDLDAGEDVTCTFTNREHSSITVVKQTVPDGSSEAFIFDPTDGLSTASFGLTDGQSKSFGALAPGTYGVDEEVPANWQLTDISCDDDDASTTVTGFSIDLDAGEDVTCTFTNTENGNVTVIKTEDGDIPRAGISFQLTGGPDEVDLTLTTDGTSSELDFGSLKPGTYQLCELDVPEGWVTSLATPDAVTGDACVVFTLEPGEDEVFTVNNTPPAAITLDKTVDPGIGRLGDVVTYTYVFQNTGDTTLFDVTLTDSVIGQIVPPTAGTLDIVVSDGVTSTPITMTTSDALTLEAGEWVSVDVDYTIAEADLDENGDVYNLAVVVGQPPADREPVQAEDDALVDVINPSILLEKVADLETVVFDPAGVPPVITYTYSVTNTGDVTLTNLVLDDDILGPITLADTTLGPGEETTGTASHTVTQADSDAGEIVNVAVVVGTAPDGGRVGDDDDETVGVSEVLPQVIERPEPPAPAPEPEPKALPKTGIDSDRLVAWAVMMLAIGAAFLGLGRDLRVATERKPRRD